MIKIKLKKEELTMLSAMKGKILKSFEYESHPYHKDLLYGNIGVHLARESFEISNEEMVGQYFDTTTDYACYHIKKINPNGFDPVVVAPTKCYMIDERIKEIYVVEDTTNINNGEFKIIQDSSIVIRTEYNIYTLVRPFYCSESMNLYVDRTEMKLPTIDEIMEDWIDCEHIEHVKITRKTINL